MKSPALVPLFLVIAAMTGCSHGYKAIGTIDGLDKPLMGNAAPASAGGGHFVLHTPADDLICEGFAAPPEAATLVSGCADQTGTGTLRCSDGRTMKLSWKALSCRAFEGTGTDADGRVLRFSVKRTSF